MNNTPRRYRLYDNEHWFSYHRLEAACWDLCVKLYNLNSLYLTLRGVFTETIGLKNEGSYHKRYTVQLLFPPTKLEIRKMTKGDIDQEEFMETLTRVYKMFNERIQNEN